MNKEEKEEIELDIEAKYADKTEKEFLSRVTYAECLYILTPENKYCDKIRELSVLKICEIIERLQKENETKNKTIDKMAEYIANGDIDEDVCRKVINGNYCDDYGENSNCKQCVIEYFKRKAEKGV